MRLVCTSDTHGDTPTDIPDGDVFIHCGDYAIKETEQEAKETVSWIGELPHRYKLFVPGNHDSFTYHNVEFFRGLCSGVGITMLDDKGIDIDGKLFWGFPWVRDPMGKHRWPYTATEDVIEKLSSFIPTTVDILLTHGPPKGILDRTKDGHIGSSAMRTLVDAYLPRLKYYICGHIHEGYGTHKENGVTFVNAAYKDFMYIGGQSPIVLDIK
jgi:Icc-related predicted phosphoesterase